MSNFYICIKAVLPIFIMILAGILSRRAKLLDEEDIVKMNRFIFVVFAPAMMFKNIYKSGFDGWVSKGYIPFGIITVLAIFFVSIFVMSRIEQDKKKRAVMIQDAFRSNFIVMGMPILINFFGEENLGPSTIMMAIIAPLFNVLAVIIFTIDGGGRLKVSEIIMSILKNPIIIGTVAGIIFSVFNIRLPEVIEKAVFGMGNIFPVMGLVLLGAAFNPHFSKAYRKDVFVIIFTSLFLIPGITLSIAAVLGFRNIEFVTLLIMLAAPPSTSSYTMAEAMGCDGELAGDAVIVGTAVSCFSIVMWLFIFRSIGLF